MVSFQCDGCADVVKKPKLDQHRARCGVSFTCIDCSKTFPTPVDWKGHTSCISEAEKYQKTLYKPKSNGGGREHTHMNGQGVKFQGRGSSWNRPPPRSQATGANGTPLGTPPRMSPVTAPPLQDETIRTAVLDPVIEPVSKEEPKKHKKHKLEMTNATYIEPVIQGADGPISREEPRAKEGKNKKDKKEKKEKKGKKEKKEKKEKKKYEKAIDLEVANGVDLSSVSPSTPADVTRDERPKKLKKEKKGSHELAIPLEVAPNGVDPSSSLPTDVPGEANPKSSRKSKKEKKHKETEAAETGGAIPEAPIEAPAVDMNIVDGEAKKKKKKRQSEMASGEPEVNGEVEDAPSVTTDRKSKKRKREAEKQEDVTGQESAAEKKKKKKKKVAVS